MHAAAPCDPRCSTLSLLPDRYGTRFVIQLDLGWTRKLVITVPHGGANATRVIRHSFSGTSALGS
jgi:hypothetical protein